MSTLRHRIAPTLVVLSLAILAADGRAGPAPDPRQGYDPRPGAAPGGSASALPPEPEPAIVDGHKPWAPALDAPFPGGVSDPPSREEWASAAPALEVRVTEPACKAQRVREWYRISCKGAQGIELISGGREGVSFGCTRQGSDFVWCDDDWVVFPARRGDRRAFEVFVLGKWGPSPDAIVTEQLLDGDPTPLVTVSGLRWGF